MANTQCYSWYETKIEIFFKHMGYSISIYIPQLSMRELNSFCLLLLPCFFGEHMRKNQNTLILFKAVSSSTSATWHIWLPAEQSQRRDACCCILFLPENFWHYSNCLVLSYTLKSVACLLKSEMWSYLHIPRPHSSITTGLSRMKFEILV